MKFTIKTDKLSNKLSPQLKKAFLQTQTGAISMSAEFNCLVKTKVGYEPENMDFCPITDDTSSATLSLTQIDELVKDENVIYIEAGRPLSL